MCSLGISKHGQSLNPDATHRIVGVERMHGHGAKFLVFHSVDRWVSWMLGLVFQNGIDPFERNGAARSA